MNKETYFKNSVKLCITSLCFLPISIIIEAILFFISDSMYINAGYISPKNDLKYKLVNIMFELVFPIYLIISLILFVRIINNLVKYVKSASERPMKIKILLSAALISIILPAFLTVSFI